MPNDLPLKYDIADVIFTAFLVCLITFLVTLFVTLSVNDGCWQREAVRHQQAHYDTTEKGEPVWRWNLPEIPKELLPAEKSK